MSLKTNLNERSQIENATCFMTPFMWYSRKGKICKQKTDQQLPESGFGGRELPTKVQKGTVGKVIKAFYTFIIMVVT
jgi:hypothetical protein